MKTLFFKTIALIFMCSIQMAAFSQVMYQISASDANIKYTGRVDLSNPSSVKFGYSGVTIRAKFQGTAIDAVIKNGPYLNYPLPNTWDADYNDKTNYFYVIIDGAIQPTRLKLTPDSPAKTYQLARGLTDGVHTIELFKLTETSCGIVEFQGFQLETGKTLLPPDPLPTRVMEFIGNSITCGYGNEGTTYDPFHAEKENGYKAFGAMVARHFTAQYSCIAASGRGLYMNGWGTTALTVPLIYDHTVADYPTPAWNRTRYTPDVIVIGLGTNDFAADNDGFWTFNATLFNDTYISFITKLRGYYPNATIICSGSSMLSDWYPEGKNTWTRHKQCLTTVVNNFKNKGDNKVHYFEVATDLGPNYGEGFHPSLAQHEKIANSLIAFINGLSYEVWSNQTQLETTASNKSQLIATSESLSISSENQISKVELIDTQGAIISAQKVGDKSVTIPIIALPKGVYMARITYTDGSSETVKFIK